MLSPLVWTFREGMVMSARENCFLLLSSSIYETDIFCLVINVYYQITFHGISINKVDIVLDGSEAPVRIDAEALLSPENLVPEAVLNKVIRVVQCPVPLFMSCHVMSCHGDHYYWHNLFSPYCSFMLLSFSWFMLQVRVPYCPIDAKLRTLSSDRDKLPSGKQTLALILTWVFVY